ncbi:MAG: hypothetical protein PWR20_1465 [Bacteroidales bacterium]|nr:hypothetical protein [Bacteroidales bacterium]MDN5330254.1 hypothetical protein [Bacteroidales bacterium]
MKSYNRINNLLGWITFAISFAVYMLTLEPTASWWDCGEYIATSFKLQVGHPPGAPTFQLINRVASLLAESDTTQVAFWVNTISALSSALTIMFLFWTITMLARKIVLAGGKELTKARMITIMGSGLIGALAYTFSDSFWFSAVEGEVYAMSSFFTALVFWAILKWELVADEEHNLRWLILIAFLIGLSIGVHLLNLLAIPAITYIYYYKKFNTITWKGIILTGIVSILILAVLMYGIIPDIVNLFGTTELLFVNTFGLPFNSGTIFFSITIIATLITGIRYTLKGDKCLVPFAISGGILALLILSGSDGFGSFLIRALLVGVSVYAILKLKNNRAVINTVILAFAFILIGYSTFLVLVIRANADTPINENDPRDAISLLSYLNREQYGTWPLFYGQYYNAPVVDYADQSPIYRKDVASGKYVIADERKGTIPVYDKRFMTIFPRMWSNQKQGHIKTYEQWGKIEGVPVTVTNSQGKTETIMKPTFGENLRFFFTYQIGHMYFRYFMWNFAGRQNDVEGHGGIEDGNWISGIKFLDEMRLGNLDKYPEYRTKNPAYNRFYLLPLILGLIGLWYHARKHGRDAFVVALLFIMTGIAIVIYLNQTPQQPRERDYSYAGSFYAFAIWIGLGVLAIAEYLEKYTKPLVAGLLATLIAMPVPYLMGKEGWDDHNRHGKTAARDFAYAYLDSTQPQSILFTFGDNDTFPIWYAQEVENHRTDVRVVNYMLASGDWYIQQMAQQVYDSKPLPFTLKPEQYTKGNNDVLPVIDLVNTNEPVTLKEIMRFIANEKNKRNFGGQKYSYIPTKRFRIPVDTAAVRRSGLVPKEMQNKILPYLDFTIRRNYIYKNDLMLLDILATNDWKRPIYFTSPSGIGGAFSLDQYCHLEGMVYKFLPVKAEDFIKGLGGVSADTCYDILVNRITHWGNLNNPKVSVDRESFRNAQIPRQNYMRVAQAMIDKGKKAEAIKALDLSLQYFPTNKIWADKYMISYVDLYYAAGAYDKANALAKELASIFSADIEYYSSLRPPYADDYQQSLVENAMNIKRLALSARQFNQEETAKEIESMLKMNLVE